MRLIINKSKKAKYIREVSRETAFKGFSLFSKNTLNETTIASFIRKSSKFPLNKEEVSNYLLNNIKVN